MHIEFFITEKDYRRAALLAMRKRSNLSALDYYLPYIVTGIWIAASLITSYLHPDQDFDLFLTLGVAPVLMAFLWMRRKRLEKEFTRLRALHLLQIMDLDSVGLRLSTSEGIVGSKWNIYSKFAEDDSSYVLFHQDALLFLPIPKRNLTIAQTDELRALLTARLPRK